MVKSDSNTPNPSSHTKQHWGLSVWRRPLKFLFPFQVPGWYVGQTCPSSASMLGNPFKTLKDFLIQEFCDQICVKWPPTVHTFYDVI